MEFERRSACLHSEEKNREARLTQFYHGVKKTPTLVFGYWYSEPPATAPIVPGSGFPLPDVGHRAQTAIVVK